jgi:starvation-inducible DNA-binding protein
MNWVGSCHQPFKEKMIMEMNTGLSAKQRQAVIKALEPLLADEIALYFATRGAHWNVVGMGFGALHKFFEAQYEALDDIMDDVAERIRALGAKAPATVAGFGKATRLKEGAGEAKNAEAMIKGLLAMHEQVVRQLRKDIDVASEATDEGTADFLTGLVEEHEKMAWMLRAHLE